MPIGLTDKIEPKNAAFIGIVAAKQVLGGGADGTLPDAVVASSNVTQFADASGPASAVDGNIAAFDGTTGKLIKDDGGTTGTGVIVRTTSPTLVTPVVASGGFTNANHNHSNAGNGGGLALAATAWTNMNHAHTATNNGGTLVPSAVPKLQKGASMYFLESPAVNDEYPQKGLHTDVPITITKVLGETDAGTCDIQLYQRTFGSAFSGGTAVITATNGLQAAVGGASTTAFADATVPGNTWIVPVIKAVASATKCLMRIEYTVDD